MKPVLSHIIRLRDLPRRKPTQVVLAPDEGAREDLADRLDVDRLEKVRLDAELAPSDGRDWRLTGRIKATVTQPCRVTTEPVVTRIEEAFERRYVADMAEPSGPELEMPEDDSAEPLPDFLDVGDVLEETLALAIPEFPRAEGAEEVDLSAAPPGATPFEEERVKPFAGLASLKARLEGDDDA